MKITNILLFTFLIAWTVGSSYDTDRIIEEIRKAQSDKDKIEQLTNQVKALQPYQEISLILTGINDKHRKAKIESNKNSRLIELRNKVNN